MPTTDQLLPHLVHLRRPRTCFRCREREPGRLQLRVILKQGEGVCVVLVEEHESRVEVLVLVCGEVEDRANEVDCPVHVYLDHPLGDREVVDAVRDAATVDEFVPRWG